MAYILRKAHVLCQAANKNTIFAATTKIISMKNHRDIINRTNLRAEQRFKSMDNINKDYNLVYREHRGFIVIALAGYYGGWISILFSAIFIGYISVKDPPVQQEKIEASKPRTKARGIIFLLCGIIISFLVIIVSKAIPFRIYHNPKEKLFKAVFTHNLLGKKQILTYNEGAATPAFTRVRFMTNTLYNINGRTVILDKESFPVPYLRELMLRNIK